MSITIKRVCGYCHKQMPGKENGTSPLKHIDIQRFKQYEKIDKDTNIRVEHVCIEVKGCSGEDMCKKCALEFTQTYIKEYLTEIT